MYKDFYQFSAFFLGDQQVIAGGKSNLVEDCISNVAIDVFDSKMLFAI